MLEPFKEIAERLGKCMENEDGSREKNSGKEEGRENKSLFWCLCIITSS